MRRCSRCVLAEDFPNITFNEEGVCNYCLAWDRRWKNFDYEKSEAELIDLFAVIKKKKRKYDCLIPYSGGRDSSYVVYLCKKKYGLNPLLVTFNNLFMSEHAIKNINSMVEIMDVEHRFITYKPQVLKRFYRAAIEKGGEFCSICAAGINYAKIIYQRLYSTPIVITGTSGRVDEQSPFEVNSTHPVYVRRLLSSAGFNEKEINDYVIERHFEWSLFEKMKRKVFDNDYLELSLPDYVKWDNQEICKVLQDELSWETPGIQQDHIDCKFASLKTYLKNQQIRHFIFKQEKFSQLIRDDQMTRDEALEALYSLIKSEGNRPDEFEEFMEFLNLKESSFERLGETSHLDFISKNDIIIKENIFQKIASRIWQFVKYFKEKCH